MHEEADDFDPWERPSNSGTAKAAFSRGPDIIAALRAADSHPFQSPEYRAEAERAYALLQEAIAEGDPLSTEPEFVRAVEDLTTYLAIDWDTIDTIEVRHSDETTEIVNLRDDPSAIRRLRDVSALRVVQPLPAVPAPVEETPDDELERDAPSASAEPSVGDGPDTDGGSQRSGTEEADRIDASGPPGQPRGRADVPKGIITEYPSGITSYLDWGFEGDAFQVKGHDLKPGGGDYEYFATIERDDLPALANALGTDVTGIEAAWAAQIAQINTPGFTTWLKNHGIEFQFHTWGSFDWYE